MCIHYGVLSTSCVPGEEQGSWGTGTFFFPGSDAGRFFLMPHFSSRPASTCTVLHNRYPGAQVKASPLYKQEERNLTPAAYTREVILRAQRTGSPSATTKCLTSVLPVVTTPMTGLGLVGSSLSLLPLAFSFCPRVIPYADFHCCLLQSHITGLLYGHSSASFSADLVCVFRSASRSP